VHSIDSRQRLIYVGTSGFENVLSWDGMVHSFRLPSLRLVFRSVVGGMW
jgi:hypothetical protein